MLLAATKILEAKQHRCRDFNCPLMASNPQQVMTRMGAIMAAGILDAGGRNATVGLRSRSGHFRWAAGQVGMHMWPCTAGCLVAAPPKTAQETQCIATGSPQAAIFQPACSHATHAICMPRPCPCAGAPLCWAWRSSRSTGALLGCRATVLAAAQLCAAAVPACNRPAVRCHYASLHVWSSSQ